jgi:hypothetical protein
MPALNPLTGLGGLNPSGGAPASVPAVGYTGADSGPVVVQTATGSTAVSGPASFTLTFASTQVGSTLVVFVAVNASAAAALGATPTGWTLVWSQVVGTLALGCYAFYNNPGAITAFTLASPTATLGGIAGIGYEVQNCPFLSDLNQNQTGNSTAPASGAAQLQPPATCNTILGAVAWVLGAATLTIGNTTPTGTIATTTAQISSTNGTTNAAIRATVAIQPAMVSGASTGFIIAGTLSAGAVWDAGAINLRSLASDYSVGSSDQNAEYPGFSIIAGGQQAISVGRL